MGLQIAKREREGIQLLELKGRLVAGDEAAAFRSAIAEFHSADDARVILCMGDVDYVDSTGLGALVMAATQLKRLGGSAKLMHVNRRNIELLVLTKIDTMFDVFDDETDAVNSFFPGREIRKFDILSFVQGLKDSD